MSGTKIDHAARHKSPWTRRERIGRALWYLVQGTLFRWSPRVCYGWRNWLLRRFGAKLHYSVRIHRTVTIEVPWHLSMGADSVVGDRAILYCLGQINMGERVLISQYAHLCAGSHDHTTLEQPLPLLKLPITLEDDVWIAADAFVGPGVTIGQGTVVGARASVFSDLPGWKICVSNPAKPIRDRVISSSLPIDETGARY